MTDALRGDCDDCVDSVCTNVCQTAPTPTDAELIERLRDGAQATEAIRANQDYDDGQRLAFGAVSIALTQAADRLTSLSAQIEELRAALERIADPRNIHFAGDAQVVARTTLGAQP